MKSYITQDLLSLAYILTVTDNRNRTNRTEHKSFSFARRKEINAYLDAIMCALKEWLKTAKVKNNGIFLQTVEALLKQKSYKVDTLSKEQPIIRLLENEIAPKLKNSAYQDSQADRKNTEIARQIIKDISKVARLWAVSCRAPAAGTT